VGTEENAVPDREPPGTGWAETYAGGSPAAEAAQFEGLARRIAVMQRVVTQRSGGIPRRALHAKATLALTGAELRFHDDLPADLRHGFAQPGARYPVDLRFSNAAQTVQADDEPDMRGAALRVHVSAGASIDLLMTNYPVSHARDAEQFVELALAFARYPRARALWTLSRRFGVRETVRMVRNVSAARRHRPVSILTETYWSRGALSWGPTVAVRYRLRPSGATHLNPAAAPPTGRDRLTAEAARRLSAGPVRMQLCVQRYVDAASTPIEDTSVPWTEEVAPVIPVAELTVPAVDMGSAQARETADRIEAMEFSPWNTVEGFRPLGNLNRARNAAYRASARGRSAKGY
jgi:catalase